MANLPNSFITIHPGEILKEELQVREISQKKIAEIIDVPYTMLNEILNGKRELSTRVALLFEAAIDINADMLINIQTRYNLQVARKSNEYIKISKSVRELAAEWFAPKAQTPCLSADNGMALCHKTTK